MFEEASGVLHWSPFMTLASIICSSVAVLTNTFLMDASGMDPREVYQLVLFSMPRHERIDRAPWGWIDLVLISLIAVVCGRIVQLFISGLRRVL